MKRVFLILSGFVLLVMIVVASGLLYLRHWSGQPLLVSSRQVVEVEPGFSLYHVAHLLQREGMLKHGLLLRLYGRLQPSHAMIQAGEYEITPGMTPAMLLHKLESGEVVQYSVTLVDGQTFAAFEQSLKETGKITITLDKVKIGDLLHQWGDSHTNPEGQFFPDTYQFRKGDTDVSILHRAYLRMQQQLQSAWENRAQDLPYKTPYEALIMASIVEKETGEPGERAEIAGIFVNRLKKHMRLQTDPTVIYGLGDQYKGNLTKAHLSEYTPYNTYRIEGLPPTPIANPGLAAIDAALHPAPTKALYFVAKGDGSHQFSDTLAEHEAAVRKYQRNRRADYRSSPK